MSKKEKKLAQQIVSFRVDDEDAQAAEAEAKKFGLSPHALARQVFLEWLRDTERHELRRAVADLSKEVVTQKADLKEAVVAILCDAGKLEEVEARQWVESRFFH